MEYTNTYMGLDNVLIHVIEHDISLTLDIVFMFKRWVDAIDTNQWPPNPVMEGRMAGVAMNGRSQTLLGKHAFEEYRCDLCHKIGEKGGVVGPDLTHVGSKRESPWLIEQIKNPKSNKPDAQMPAFPQIPETEIHALADYLTSLK